MLVKSDTELVRFADVVDGLSDPGDGTGAYVAGAGHCVVWNPRSETVLAHAGRSAVDVVRDPGDRPVGW